MKIRSLLLGSVAAAGLSTGAFAADLGVLTSLDVCDSLGLSGLTISSDTNCLQITGSVSYEFRWGDYEGDTSVNGIFPFQSTAANDHLVGTGDGTHSVATAGMYNADPDLNHDWYSKVEAWIKFVATADSDFGPAKAVIKIRDRQYRYTTNEGYGIDSDDDGQLDTNVHGDDTGGPEFNEAYVQIGDATVIMAGKKGSIMKFGEDEPLNFLGLFNSEKVDTGVKWADTPGIGDGGHVIQVVSDLGNGVSVGAGLEKLDTSGASAGTAVGILSYAGDGIAAHLTVVADGVLTGTIQDWGFHAGVAGTFDMIKFVAAAAGDSSGYWNALGSVAATFDMFTIAVSGEVVNVTTTQQLLGAGLDYGFGGSVGAAVTDTVTINVGGRWYHDALNPTTGVADDGWQAAIQLVAAVTETITLTGEVGIYGDVETAGAAGAETNVFYGAGAVAWAPGGNFTSSLKGEVFSNGAYRATFKAAKTFE